MELINWINETNIMKILNVLFTIIGLFTLLLLMKSWYKRLAEFINKRNRAISIIKIMMLILIFIFMFLITPIYGIITSIFWMDSFWRYLLFAVSIIGFWNLYTGISFLHKVIKISKDLPNLPDEK